MSILLDKRELKKAAKELTLVKLNDVIETLNAVLAERHQEVELVNHLEQIAKEKGYTFEQLGYKRAADLVVTDAQPAEQHSARPVKPKFKTINKDKQMFYVENGSLHLLATHTMKKGLQERGISVVPLSQVDKKFAKDTDKLIAEATAKAVDNFNAKVVVWNAWATEHGGEILTPR
ncbi:H-NS family histone-like protein [Arsukibacterium sp.]|uniref:H-NS family histone-like protein n=1 Tax=Arsukibacterium sp. TaxID=1977258 RepID=UPI002FDAC40A